MKKALTLDTHKFLHTSINDYMIPKFDEYIQKFTNISDICMLLDPRYKLSLITDSKKKKEAKESFVKNVFVKYKKLYDSQKPEQIQNGQSPLSTSIPKGKNKTLSIMERHFMGANTEAAASAKSEIDRYLCEPQEPFNKQL